jgi:hypothetical protein
MLRLCSGHIMHAQSINWITGFGRSALRLRPPAPVRTPFLPRRFFPKVDTPADVAKPSQTRRAVWTMPGTRAAPEAQRQRQPVNAGGGPDAWSQSAERRIPHFQAGQPENDAPGFD